MIGPWAKQESGSFTLWNYRIRVDTISCYQILLFVLWDQRLWTLHQIWSWIFQNNEIHSIDWKYASSVKNSIISRRKFVNTISKVLKYHKIRLIKKLLFYSTLFQNQIKKSKKKFRSCRFFVLKVYNITFGRVFKFTKFEFVLINFLICFCLKPRKITALLVNDPSRLFLSKNRKMNCISQPTLRARRVSQKSKMGQIQVRKNSSNENIHFFT